VQIWGQIIADGRAWFDDVRWQEKGSGISIWWMVATAVLLVMGLAVFVLLRRPTRSE
jgi:hypothetical protein